ncbi:MAG: PD-(D/E)XK nuclease family protein [Desulfohalobiaceae bacterium]|nr:PD-(D/E)XK nuclease family protein [Desulfohalobiaceae bacterium]
MNKASVSEILLAARCPRLLAYHLSGGAGAWRQGRGGAGPMPGKLFHDELAAPLHQALSSGDNQLCRELQESLDVSSGGYRPQILAFLERRCLLPLLREKGGSLSSEGILALARGVETWGELIDRFLSSTGETDLTRVFHDPERDLEAELHPRDGEPVQVRGRYDSLLFDVSAGEGVLLEFKGGTRGGFPEAFLQVALYAMLVRETTRVAVRAMICHLEEEETPVTEYSAAELEAAREDVLAAVRQSREVKRRVVEEGGSGIEPSRSPQVCGECAYASRCDRDWGGGEEDFPDEAGQGLETIVDVLQSLNIGVRAEGYINGPRFIRYKILPRKGTTVRKLLNKSEDLQIALSSPVPPLIRTQAGYVSLDVPKQNTTPLTLRDVWNRGAESRPASRAAFPLGMTIEGEVEWADLSDPTMTSVLVGGTAGSGKSVFLRAAAVGLALNASERELELTLIDPKRVSFTDLKDLPHLASNVLMESGEALEALESLVETMEERYRLLEASGEADVTEYNKRNPLLPHQVLLIDEYADLILDREYKKRLETSVQRLGQKGRAAGVHLLLSTQRPDANIITPAIKANLQLTVALKVTNSSNSRVILNEAGAERLVGYGDMLVGGSVPVQRLQGPLVTREDIDAAFAHSNS